MRIVSIQTTFTAEHQKRWINLTFWELQSLFLLHLELRHAHLTFRQAFRMYVCTKATPGYKRNNDDVAYSWLYNNRITFFSKSSSNKGATGPMSAT